jgi:hypothetical protein
MTGSPLSDRALVVVYLTTSHVRSTMTPSAFMTCHLVPPAGPLPIVTSFKHTPFASSQFCRNVPHRILKYTVYWRPDFAADDSSSHVGSTVLTAELSTMKLVRNVRFTGVFDQLHDRTARPLLVSCCLHSNFASTLLSSITTAHEYTVSVTVSPSSIGLHLQVHYEVKSRPWHAHAGTNLVYCVRLSTFPTWIPRKFPLPQ